MTPRPEPNLTCVSVVAADTTAAAAPSAQRALWDRRPGIYQSRAGRPGVNGPVLPKDSPNPLLQAFFERRDSLKRFYVARLGSLPEAEDLLQDLYLKVAAAESQQVENPAAYVYRLASNAMLDRLRSQRRTAMRERDWRDSHHVIVAGEDVADIPGAEQVIAARDRLALVVRALEELGPQTQKVFRLHKFDGLSHMEVAQRLGISRSAVEKHVMAALKHLLIKVGHKAP